jgi:hypothetical protein
MEEYYKLDKEVNNIYRDIGNTVINNKYVQNQENIERVVYYNDKIVIMSKDDTGIKNFKQDIENIVKEFVHDYDIGYTIYKDDKVSSNFISVIKNNPSSIKQQIQMYGTRYNISDDIIEYSINLSEKLNLNELETDNMLLSYAILKIICDKENEIIYGSPEYSKSDLERTRSIIIENINPNQI